MITLSNRDLSAKFNLKFGVVLLAALLASSAGVAQEVNLCEGAATHVKSVNIPKVAKPPYKRYFKDPAFGSKIIRISEAAQGEVFKPPYSTMQAWNADESLMLVYRTGLEEKGHYLLDGHTYDFIEKLDIYPADLEEVFWSHSDPDVLFYTSKRKRELGHFYRWNVAAKSKTLISDFSSVCQGSLPVGGKGVHMQSLDDDLFGFRCRDLSGGKGGPKKYKMFTYRISTDKLTVSDLGPGTRWHNWTAPSPAPSGDRVWLQGHTMENDLETIAHQHDMGNTREHANIGLTHDGSDAIFQVVFDPSPSGCGGDKYKGISHLTEFNLETGACRPVIGQSKGYPYTTSATHLSAQAYKRPGWIALSSIGSEKQMALMKSGEKVPTLLSEIYLANTDPENEVVCRLAHHRSTGKRAKNSSYKAYFGEPHVTISPSGTRLVYGSDWYDSGSVDTYVIELPAYRKPN